MKKIINDAFGFVDDTISGILKAHPRHFRRVPGSDRAIMRADAPVKGKVAIVTGGGSGHLPVFLGYVGPGLCDGVAIGNVFSSPASDDMLAAFRGVHGGDGVLCLYRNYGGDRMNFDLAAELVAAEGIVVRQALVRDDVASAPPDQASRRRAVAGLFFAYKVAGAKAESGAGLDEVAAAAEAAIANTRSMGIALSPCVIPAAGKPTFTLADDEMGVGMGIHGEPGIAVAKLATADEIAGLLVEKIVGDLPFAAGDEVAALVNGLGATPPEELYVLWNRVHDLLAERGLRVRRCFVGEYATSMEMAGCSLSLMRLDAGLAAMLEAPCRSPLLLQGG